MLDHLSSAGVNIIAGEPPLPNLREHWVASLRFDLLESFIDFWPEYMAGSDIRAVAIPLQITDANPELLSPGKQRLVQDTLVDVLGGYIDLGIDVNTDP